MLLGFPNTLRRGQFNNSVWDSIYCLSKYRRAFGNEN